MIESAIRKLIYLLLIAFPTGLLFRIKLNTNTYVVPHDIIVLCIFLLTIYFYLRKRSFPKNNFFKFQVGFVMVGFLSLVINYIYHKDTNFFVSFLYLVRYISYLSIIIAPGIEKASYGIRRALLLCSLAIIAMGFWQFFFYDDLLSLFYLGWDNHLYRMFSSFLDPNFAGVFFVIAFLFLFIKIIKGSYKDTYKEIILSFYALIAMYLTFSRTALVALFAGLFSLALIKKKLKMFIITLVILSSFLLLISDTNTEGLNPFRTASTSSRIISLKESVGIISNNALIGVGFNAFRYAQIRYGYRNVKGASNSNADAGTDNSLLFVFVTTGIFGFLFYIGSWYFLLRDTILGKANNRIMYISILLAVFAASLFTNVLFYTPIISFLLLIIVTIEKAKVEK